MVRWAFCHDWERTAGHPKGSLETYKTVSQGQPPGTFPTLFWAGIWSLRRVCHPEYSDPWRPVLPVLSEGMHIVGEVSFHTFREEMCYYS